MKKAAFIACLFIVISLKAQRTFHYALGFGAVGNSSEFVSGSETAHGLFNHNDHGSGILNFTVEKELNMRFSLESSLSFTGLGFNYSLNNERYSLRKPFTRQNESITENCIGQIPVFLNLRTKLNCLNNRLFIGAGPQLMFSTSDYIGSTHMTTTEGVKADSYLQESSMNAFATFSLAGHGGIEHVYKKGNKIRLGLIVNRGFSELGYSTVKYTIDNESYSHTFSNSGNYCGFFMSYFFR